MKKITPLKSLTFLIALFCAVNFGFGQIVAWDLAGNTGDETTVDATTLAANLNTSTLSRGSGLTERALTNAFSSGSFLALGTQANAIAADEYIQFQVSASSSYQVSLSTLDADFRRTSNGPSSFIWRYSIDGSNFTDIGVPFTFTGSGGDGTTQAQINLSTIPALQNVEYGTTITFRLYGWGATDGNGRFAIGRIPGNNALRLGGTVTVAPPCTTVSTYTTSGGWSNGLPNSLSVAAIINDSYNTSSGNIIACNLTVSNNATLNIANNSFVEIQNDITVDSGSTILVQPQAAVVQLDDLGAVNNSGTIRVSKLTAPANAWYEYTYWSSPVSGETLEQGLFESASGRRFIFNGQNFLDATAETGNNNAAVAGQDDIDDNNNDWQWVNGLTTMTPGVGYAATHDETVFNFTPGFPKRIIYNFEGDFNNGVITVPIYRNDSELNDYNWNFIGNPYPSAIDADLFLAANSDVSTDVVSTKSLNGAIFLWSQNTAPSSTTNGNEVLNFSNDDYAIINAVGENAGGDGVMPSRFIPSGQGFFVSYSNAATPLSTSTNSDGHSIAQGSVTFNNSMRVKGATDNSQFFKGSNAKEKSNADDANKLWVNLTSDNGVFNQILVGYVNGATNNDDGTSYDTAKYPTKGSALYSTIEGSNKKFAIQGKDIHSLDLDEVIKLGFKTTINVATLYTLSVAQLQGDFLSGNTVYLKDNLLNKVHDLSASDYTFTSEVGEFNDRFEIVFNASALSTDEVASNKNVLRIVELDDDFVEFNTSNNLKIESVSVFDPLGRQLYQFEGQNSTETYKLSNISSTIYIAKVKLSNGAVITKKAVKK